MHILIGLITLIGAALFWYYRIRVASEAAADVADAANDVRLTIRRLMNRRKFDVHPTESIDDARLAASGLVVAIATMDAPMSQKEITALSAQAQAVFDVTEREALDIVSFGRWIAGECGTNEEAVRKLSRRVAKLAGPEAGPDMLQMIETVATADGKALGDAENDALATVRRALSVG